MTFGARRASSTVVTDASLIEEDGYVRVALVHVCVPQRVLRSRSRLTRPACHAAYLASDVGPRGSA